jgi:hypothetical protein
MADRLETTETDRMDLTARVVRAARMVRMTVAVLGIMQVLAGALTVAHATIKQLQGRELAEDLQGKLLRRTWRKSAMTTRGVSAVRKITSAPRRTISTRRKMR